jgi:tRNA(fMet)-specific endonuclease VapC
MTRYLLDSNVLLHVVNRAAGYEKIVERLAIAKMGTVLVSAVTVWEVVRMAEKAKVPAKASKAAVALLEIFDVEPLAQQAAALGGAIHAALSKIGLTIGERDSMIAGIAVAGGFVLVSDNTREFSRVQGLVLENWRQ